MKFTKIKNMLHYSGEPALLLVANTTIPANENIQNVLISVKNILTSWEYIILPAGIRPADALYAKRFSDRLDENPGVFDPPVRRAHEWLKAHENRNVIVEIEDVFVTPTTWFVSFWCIPVTGTILDYNFNKCEWRTTYEEY